MGNEYGEGGEWRQAIEASRVEMSIVLEVLIHSDDYMI